MTPANVNANVHANMNASEHANSNMGNMNMGNPKKANANKTPWFQFHFDYLLKMPAGLFSDGLHLKWRASHSDRQAISKMRSPGRLR